VFVRTGRKGTIQNELFLCHKTVLSREEGKVPNGENLGERAKKERGKDRGSPKRVGEKRGIGKNAGKNLASTKKKRERR